MSEIAPLAAERDLGPHMAMIRRDHAWLVLPPLLAGLVAFAGIGPIRAALARFDLANAPNPYFVPDQALLLYLIVPLATLGLAAFVMAPGLLLAAGIGRDKSPAQWLLAGLALSLALLVPATSVVQLVSGTVLRGEAFLLLVAAVCAAVLPFPLRRLAAGRPLALALAGRRADLAFALIVPLVTLLVFSAKFYWENFSPDGSGGLQFTRLYTATLWPFWPASAGTVAQAPGLTSFVFALPGSWFLRAIGEYEYAVRAPMLLYLGLLHPTLVALIRTGREATSGGEIGFADHLLIGAIQVLFTLALVYSGGYHPWFNDSPMPAVRETLTLVAFLGFVLFMFERRWGWMAAYGVLAYTSIPTGIMWAALIPLLAWLVWRLDPRLADRPPLTPAFLLFGALVLITLVGPVAIRAASLPLPGDEFDLRASIDRIRYVSLSDWERIAYLLVPGGIVPALALFAWKRQDGLARVLTLATAAMFLFFWFQAYRVLLHHFVPAMLLPLIVYWRTLVLPAAEAARRAAPWRLAVLGGIVVATILAWPVHMRLHTHDRAFGAKILTRGPAFEVSAPAEGERFHGFSPVALDVVHELLPAAFPPDYRPEAPAEKFFGGPHVWFYYSQFPKPAGFVPNYDIRPLAMPGEGTLVAEHLGYGLFIRDLAEYRRDRTQRLPINTGAPLLATERDIIFGRGARSGERIVIDLVAIARRVLGQPAR